MSREGIGLVAVIPVGPGREENLRMVYRCLGTQLEQHDAVIVVQDGCDVGEETDDAMNAMGLNVVRAKMADRHTPGHEQPRNIGVRLAVEYFGATHVHFLDSDIVLEEDAVGELLDEIEADQNRILVSPYDWMPPGLRPELEGFWSAAAALENDPRWSMFRASPSVKEYTADLSAGLACFSGNLVWPTDEFTRVGGFWSEIHHGRCEDGELGLRAVAMGVPISFVATARGYHLYHEVNTALALERNERDVPMLNARHPWVEGAAVFMVDRDGKAFDVTCSRCGGQVRTIDWWVHAEECGASPGLPVHLPDTSLPDPSEGEPPAPSERESAPDEECE